MTRTFRDRLIKEMEAQDISIAELSRRSKVSYDQIRKLRERPAATTGVDDARKIAKALGYSLDEFFQEQVEDQARAAAEWLALPEGVREQSLAYARGVLAGSKTEDE